MAHFDTEYQRLEASYSDSPPGEENLLMHVPEGAKCMTHIHKSQTNRELITHRNAPFFFTLIVMPNNINAITNR